MIKRFVNAIDENQYLILGRSSAVVIDPGIGGKEAEELLEGLPVSAVILTHGHFDHIHSAKYYADRYGAKIYIHRDDEPYLSDMRLCDPVGFGMQMERFSADVLLKHDDVIDFEDEKIRVLHTPGHTPGSICLLYGECMFSGDTIFENGIGRTDFPGSSYDQMRGTLAGLKELDDNIRVYPGHGNPTYMVYEKENFIYYGI